MPLRRLALSVPIGAEHSKSVAHLRQDATLTCRTRHRGPVNNSTPSHTGHSGTIAAAPDTVTVPRWIMDSAASPGATCLYIHMEMYRQDGKDYPGAAAIAHRMRISERTVRAYMRELVTLGAVTRLPGFTPGNAARYYLHTEGGGR